MNYKFFELLLFLEMRFLNFFGPFFKIDITALAASNPLFGFYLILVLPHLSLACFLFKAVIIPFPIGLL